MTMTWPSIGSYNENELGPENRLNPEQSRPSLADRCPQRGLL